MVPKDLLSKADIDRIIEMAWEDRTTFDSIQNQFGINEQAVKNLMKSNLRPSSYKLWRKRVHTKSIKNGKKFLHERKKLNRFQKII